MLIKAATLTAERESDIIAVLLKDMSSEAEQRFLRTEENVISEWEVDKETNSVWVSFTKGPGYGVEIPLERFVKKSNVAGIDEMAPEPGDYVDIFPRRPVRKNPDSPALNSVVGIQINGMTWFQYSLGEYLEKFPEIQNWLGEEEAKRVYAEQIKIMNDDELSLPDSKSIYNMKRATALRNTALFTGAIIRNWR